MDTPAPPSFISTQVRRARLFFLNLEVPADHLELAVTCGGFEAVSREYHIERSSFPWYSVEFVTAGEGRVTLGGVESPLRAGSFFVYGPGLSHTIWSEPGLPLEKYFVDFTGEEAGALLLSLGLLPGTHAESTQPSTLREDFEALIEAGNRHSPHAAVYCRARLMQLLVNCADFKAEPGTLGSRAFESYQRCCTRIRAQARQLRDLEQMAELCHLDKSYLCRLFARFGSQSPRDFLLHQKIEVAAWLLLDSPLSVKQVASDLGFSDPFHFSKVFKRVKGVPPARFALRHRPTLKQKPPSAPQIR